MNNVYYLQIDIDDSDISLLKKVDTLTVLALCTGQFGNAGQSRDIEQKKQINYITFFLNLLEGKYEALEKLGISREMISIWHLYEYKDNCYLKYSPDEFKRMGMNGLTLCVSCYNADSKFVF